MEDQSEQTTDKPTAEEAAPTAEEQKPSRPVVEELSDINSLEDVWDIFSDGIDRVKEGGADEVKNVALKVANRGLKGWRKLIDALAEGKD